MHNSAIETNLMKFSVAFAVNLGVDIDLVDPTFGPLTDCSEDGVDLTLVRWMLSLTPAERLEFHEQHVNSILRFQKRNGIQPLSDEQGCEQ